MVDVKDSVGNVWSFHVDKKLIPVLEKIRERVTKKDKDYVTLIDGYEGAGKSTFGMQIGKYVDPDLNISRVCMTADEFKKAVVTAEKGQCVIYDEAVTGMMAGDSISRIGKLLKSLMMQMRQKNLFIIVILPTIFELNKYVVLSRAKNFFHIYETGGKMGYWVGYNRHDLKKLYIMGKRNYAYRVKSKFKGRFHGKYTIDEEKYRKKKEETLALIDEDDRPVTHRWEIQRNFLICVLNKQGYTHKELEGLFKACKYHLTGAAVGLVTIKSGKWMDNVDFEGIIEEFNKKTTKKKR